MATVADEWDSLATQILGPEQQPAPQPTATPQLSQQPASPQQQPEPDWDALADQVLGPTSPPPAAPAPSAPAWMQAPVMEEPAVAQSQPIAQSSPAALAASALPGAQPPNHATPSNDTKPASPPPTLPAAWSPTEPAAAPVQQGPTIAAAQQQRVRAMAKKVMDLNVPPALAGAEVIAPQVAPEDRDAFLEALYEEAKARQNIGKHGALARGGMEMFAQLGDMGAAVRRWTGNGPDPDMERFARKIHKTWVAADPMIKPDDPWYKRGAMAALGMAPKLLLAAGPGKAGAAGATALGAGKGLAAFAGGAAGSLIFAPEMYDEAYDNALDAGLHPRDAKWVAGTSATIQSLLFAGIAGKLVPGAAKGVTSKLSEAAIQKLGGVQAISKVVNSTLAKNIAKYGGHVAGGAVTMGNAAAVDATALELGKWASDAGVPEFSKVTEAWIAGTKEGAVTMPFLAAPTAIAEGVLSDGKNALRPATPPQEPAKKRLGQPQVTGEEPQTQESHNAQRIEEAGSNNGSRGPRPEVRQESRDTAVGSQGVQPSRPGDRNLGRPEEPTPREPAAVPNTAAQEQTPGKEAIEAVAPQSPSDQPALPPGFWDHQPFAQEVADKMAGSPSRMDPALRADAADKGLAKALQTYDPAKSGEMSLENWIKKIVRQEVVRAAQPRSNGTAQPIGEKIEDIPEQEPAAPEAMVAAEEQDRQQKIVDAMPAEDQNLWGMTVPELRGEARKLGVRQNFHREAMIEEIIRKREEQRAAAAELPGTESQSSQPMSESGIVEGHAFTKENLQKTFGYSDAEAEATAALAEAMGIPSEGIVLAKGGEPGFGVTEARGPKNKKKLTPEPGPDSLLDEEGKQGAPGAGSKLTQERPEVEQSVRGNPHAQKAREIVDQHFRGEDLTDQGKQAIAEYLTTGDRTWLQDMGRSMINRGLEVTGDTPLERMERHSGFVAPLFEKYSAYHSNPDSQRLPVENVREIAQSSKEQVSTDAKRMRELYPEMTEAIDKEEARLHGRIDKYTDQVLSQSPRGSIHPSNVVPLIEEFGTIATKDHWEGIGEAGNRRMWHGIYKTLPKWRVTGRGEIALPKGLSPVSKEQPSAQNIPEVDKSPENRPQSPQSETKSLDPLDVLDVSDDDLFGPTTRPKATPKAQESEPDTLFDAPKPEKKPWYGNARASMEILEDGRALVRSLKNPNASSGAHELLHVSRKWLFKRDVPEENRLGITDEHIRAAEEWCGVKDGKWTREADEKFANGGIRYLLEGKAPNAKMAEVFFKFKEWLAKIFSRLEKSKINLDISPEMKQVYDALFSRGEVIKDKTQESSPSMPLAEAELPAVVAGTPDTTSTKKAVVSEIRARRGEEPVPGKEPETVEEWRAEAQRQMEEDPSLATRLVQELLDSPRDIGKVEVQILQRHYGQQNSRLKAASQALVEAQTGGDEAAITKAQEEANVALSDLQQTERALEVKGRLWGQSGVSQQAVLKNDYSLERRLLVQSIAKGGKPLTTEEHTTIAESTAKIEKLTAELEKSQAENKRLTEAHETVVKQAESARKRPPADAIREYANHNGLDYETLLRAAEEVHQGMKDEISERRAAKLAAHRMTGLNSLDVARIENSGHDYATTRLKGVTGQKVRTFDEYAQEIVSQYPEVFGDTPDPSRAVWDLLREPAIKDLRMDDPRVLREAAAMASDDFSLAPEYPPAKKVPVSAKRAAAKKKVADAWADFGKQIRGTAYSNPLDPNLLIAAAKVVKAHVELGVVTFTEFMARAKERMGEEAEKSRRLFAAAWKQVKESGEVPQREIDATDPGEVSLLAKRLHREVVELGITDRDQAVDSVHEELQQYIPDITRRQTEDAMSGYGDFKQLSKDEISLKVREHKGELQQLAKLEDMRKGQAPKKTGVERREPSNEERLLIQQVNEAKKRGGFIVTDPAKQLKGAMDSAKTAVRNRIADMEKEIVTGERIVKNRTALKPDAELMTLRKKRDELRAIHEEIFPRTKKVATPEQQLAAIGRALDRAIVQMESDLAAGKIGHKPMIARRSTPEIEAKQARLEALKAQREELRTHDPAYQADMEARSTAAYKRSLAKRLADYQERVAKKDFAKRSVRKRVADHEDLERLYQIEQEKRKLDAMAEQARRANRTVLGKIVGAGADFMDFSQTIMTGFEMSAVLRQGLTYTLGFPEKAIPALFQTAKAVFSERAEFAIHEDLRQRPNAPDYFRGKLEMTAKDGPLSSREELLRSRLLDWMEEGKRSRWNIPAHALQGSVRGFRTYCNIMRADLFDYMKANVEANRPWTPDDAKVIGQASNLFSGRGNIRNAVGLSRVFFAPRWVWSRVQLAAGQPLWKGNSATRLAIGKVYVRWALGMAAYLGLRHVIYSLTAEDEKHKPRYELDPRSSDFGKMRLGNTRVDTAAGFNQLATLGARLATGTRKSARGAIIPIRGSEVPHGGDTSFDVIADFGRRKLAPLPSAVLDYLSGTTGVGQPATLGSIAYERMTPMTWNDIFAAEKELGVAQGTVAAFDAFFGAGVNTYDSQSKTTLKDYIQGLPLDQALHVYHEADALERPDAARTLMRKYAREASKERHHYLSGTPDDQKPMYTRSQWQAIEADYQKIRASLLVDAARPPQKPHGFAKKSSQR